MFVVAGVLGAAAGFGVQMVIPAHYTSAVEVLLDPKRADSFGADASFANPYVDSEKVASVVSVIKSSELLGRVVQKEDLANDPAFGRAPQPSWIKMLSFLPGAQTHPVRMDQEAREERALDKLVHAVRVSRAGETYVLTIDVSTADPQTAQRLAQAVANEYLDDQVEMKVTAARRDTLWLTNRLTEVRHQLEASERAAEVVRAKYGLPYIGHRGDGGLNRQAQALRKSPGLPGPDEEAAASGIGLPTPELNSAVAQAQIDVETKKLRCEQVQHSQTNQDSLESSPEVASSGLIAELRLKQADVYRRLMALKSVYRSNYPELRHAQEDLSVIQERIQAEESRIANGICADYKLQLAREQSLVAQLNHAKAVEQSSPGVQGRMELLQAQRIVNATDGVYQSLLERQREVEKQQIRHEPEARVISQAKLPEFPSWPKPLLFPAAGGLFGLLSSVGISVLLPKLKNRFANAADVEKYLGLPLLGSVPMLKRRDLKAGRRPRLTAIQYAISEPLSRFSESLRAVRAALRIADVESPRVIQVTSAVPGEGKSTIAVGLAISAARAGVRTALIDADARRASISAVFFSPQRESTADGGLVEAPYRSVRYQREGLSLDVIGIRSQPAPSADIVATDGFADLLRKLSGLYDMVVLDSPPILAVSDALTIAALIDTTLFVVDAKNTPKDAAQEALRALRMIDAKIAGVVINRGEETEAYQQYSQVIDQYYSGSLLFTGEAGRPNPKAQRRIEHERV